MRKAPQRVVVESPYAGATAANARYLRACLRDSLLRGEAPFASHAIYCGPLNDSLPAERELGIAAGFEWREAAQLTAVYCDLGISSGMRAGLAHAVGMGQPVEYRTLGVALSLALAAEPEPEPEGAAVAA